MVDLVRHESFYETGTWIDESLGVYVGWSTRADSGADAMAVANERGDVNLFFSGEEFSEPETPGGLTGRRHGYR